MRTKRARNRPLKNLSGNSRPIVSTFPPLNILTEAQLQQIHDASMMILSRTGVVFNQPDAVAQFRQGGARVVDQRVYLDQDWVSSALKTAPSQYTLYARNPENTVTVGGQNTVVMPGGGPAFVRDLDGVRRPGTLADVENFARLSQMSPEVHVMARKAVEAQDAPVPLRHLECWRAILTLTDKPAQSGFVGGRAEAEDVLQMLAIVFGGEDAINGIPVAHCSVNVNSPLLYDTPMLESLLLFAQCGQPVLISPFVMAGVSGPTTLAGTLAQQNAEVLAGIVLTQLVRPGTPVLYGAATSNVDMRNANPAVGSPESALSIAACAQLARHYGLPSRGGGALTDSPIPDAQSNYERMFTLLTSILCGINYLMHGLGILESYLTMSYEQFVLDLDLLAMVRRFVNGFEISDETLALDTIHAVGPGGFFLDAAHTMRHYREAHFFPQIGIRQSFEGWESSGGQDALQRANVRCQELLEAYAKPDIDSRVADQLHQFVEDRKSKI